ncbi:uncharacterized protein UMAG_03596 [Mycosarcoma maydis]|uniref:Peroxin-7 n=1 Tax=Mycosarcoma maydis TaxID=5270 RepID=A0A0D1DWA6_MYCMD|nr:uncharacterized protein UMAG_03596 [Ustilago maydis 521]KIS68509.1 hypothetical protein UMAG_03596 [Ustilago maydis 521]|eukprot:XP_011390021.1 hypothetical protein UMAG_03596 [Ustilago maydis 521]
MYPPQPPLARVRTPGYAGYSIAWSPFFAHRLAVASSANYGLVGNGRLHILSLSPPASSGPASLTIEKVFDTQDGLYDLAFSEAHENQLVTASGDGSIKLWDCALQEHPIRNWSEHTREVFCVDWNNINKELFASSSWDASVRIWHPERPTSLTAITAHTGCVYACAFSPHNPDLLATACADGHLRLFDLRQSTAQQPSVTLPVGGEVLCLDWNKYRPMTIATGSTDRVIKTWDLRSATNNTHVGAPVTPLQMGTPTAAILGHEYAIRKVAYSPHSPQMLASASYDMTARIWDTDAAAMAGLHTAQHAQPPPATGTMRKIHDTHTEFVVGVAWSFFQDGLVASTAWDSETHLWTAP